MADMHNNNKSGLPDDGGLFGLLLFIAFGAIMLLLVAAACFPEWFGIVIDPSVESGG